MLSHADGEAAEKVEFELNGQSRTVRVLRPHAAGFAIDGSVGGRSGSPLGLKI